MEDSEIFVRSSRAMSPGRTRSGCDDRRAGEGMTGELGEVVQPAVYRFMLLGELGGVGMP